MNFFQHGKFFGVTRVTGPTHNLLYLYLSIQPNKNEVQIEELHISGLRQLSAEDVMREVCLGVEKANFTLDLSIAIRCIQFVPSDSKPPSVYKELAYALVRHYADQIR